MPAPVTRLTPIRRAQAGYLDQLLANATPSPRPMITRAPTAAELDALSTITATRLRRLSSSRVSGETLAAYASALDANRRCADLNTPLRVCHFVAQLAHECARFARMTESFAYKPDRAALLFPSKFASAEAAAEVLARDKTGEAFAEHIYGNRQSLGNTEAGDGYRYRGRGFIQLTGRANYKAMSDRIAVKGVDLVVEPDRAAEPDIAARIAVAFWKMKALNTAADRDDVGAVTRIINGGTNGLEERRHLLDIAKSAFYPRT